MGYTHTWINGVSVGFELLDKEAVSFIADGEAKWGIACDLFILRLLFVKF